MSETKHNPILRVLPSLTDLAFILPFVLLYGIRDGATTVLEGDTGWHIRTGEWILANGRVPDKDFFSFTKAGESWYAWEWGWDAIFAWLHGIGGLNLVVLASMIVISFTFVIVYRLALRKSGNPLIAIGVTIVAIAGSSIHWWARPHLFTLLFAAIFLDVLDRALEGKWRLLWVLPFLTVIWVNLHAGFFVGVVLIGATAAGRLVGALVAPDAAERKRTLTGVSPLLLSGLGCAVASFVNPYTYKLHIHIVEFFSASYHIHHITEFQSTSFHNPVAAYFEVMLVLGLVTVPWAIYRRRFDQAILVLGWTHLALYSGRNIPIYLIVSSGIVALTFAEWFAVLLQARVARWIHSAVRSVNEIVEETSVTERVGRIPLTSVLSVSLIALVAYSGVAKERFQAAYHEKKYPVKAVQELGETSLSGRVFSDSEWGDYLIYKLYPGTKVFVDGRTDFYGDEFGEMYTDTFNGTPSWHETLLRSGVETVLLGSETPLTATLRESPRWQKIYEDDVAVVFRPEPLNEASDRHTSFTACEDGKYDRKVETPTSKRRNVL